MLRKLAWIACTNQYQSFPYSGERVISLSFRGKKKQQRYSGPHLFFWVLRTKRFGQHLWEIAGWRSGYIPRRAFSVARPTWRTLQPVWSDGPSRSARACGAAWCPPFAALPIASKWLGAHTADGLGSHGAMLPPSLWFWSHPKALCRGGSRGWQETAHLFCPEPLAALQKHLQDSPAQAAVRDEHSMRARWTRSPRRPWKP